MKLKENPEVEYPRWDERAYPALFAASPSNLQEQMIGELAQQRGYSVRKAEEQRAT